MFHVTKRTLGIAAVILVGLPAGLLVYARKPMEPLAAETLDAARARWASVGPAEYEMEFEMMGGRYRVHVRRGRVLELTRNGDPTTSNRPGDFTVEGIFDTLERELEVLHSPSNPFGGDRSTTFLRVHFHPTLGYVQRYLRAVGGTGRSSAIDVTRFVPR